MSNFSGLVTYYIEGDFSQRHHLMEATVGRPERAYGVRGNIFSCLLPWDWIQKKYLLSSRSAQVIVKRVWLSKNDSSSSKTAYLC